MTRRITAAAVAMVMLGACVPDADSPNPIAEPAEALSGLRAIRGAPGRLVDGAGRDVQLRGLNVNSLGDYFEVDPRLPTVQPIHVGLWDRIADRGYNVVRLITTWSAWEPQRDQIDEAYVQRVADAIDDANAAGIYVVIDMHQDAWSKEVFTPRGVTCPAGTAPQIGWDGAPAWATITDGASTCGQGGGPGGREENPAVKAAWGSFYGNAEGIRDELAELWGYIAERFAGNDGVAGYDLLNEPGNSHDTAQTNDGLVAFYRSAIGEIRAGETRAGAPPRLVFFEGVLGTVPITPFDFSADPDLVFAPHNYAEAIGPSFPGLLETLSSITLTLGNLYRTPVWVGEYSSRGGAWNQRFAVANDHPGSVGGAWWLWNSGCGDPHRLAPVWPPTEDQIVEASQACSGATDVVAGPHSDPVCATRSYPAAAPGIGGYSGAPCGGTLRVWGASTNGGTSVPSALDVWFQPPTDAVDVPPVVSGTGVGAVTVEPTGNGWRVSIDVDGSYNITIAPG